MVKEYLAELALDIGKNWFKDRVDQQKLKSALLDYIERQRKYNEVCTFAEEIDFQGLVEYIDQNLLDTVSIRTFALKKEDRGQARASIVAAAITQAKASTIQAKSRVARCVSDCLDIIRGFYASGISKKEYILASEIVDAVSESTHQIAEEKSQAIISKIEGLENSLVNGSLFSLDKAIQLAEMGDLSAIQSGLKRMFDHISLEHPLSPHFGYTYVDGELRSKALTRSCPHKAVIPIVRVDFRRFRVKRLLCETPWSLSNIVHTLENRYLPLLNCVNDKRRKDGRKVNC